MTYALCAIGNALVDIIVSSDEAFLHANGITKGAMTLIDDATAATLYAHAGSAVEMVSGGSAANTLAGFASLGGTSAFMGKVGRDQFGEVFTHDLRAQNIHFISQSSPDLPTGRCLIFVTPDAQRSMNTCLGAAGEIYESDIEADIIRNSAITYLEGYLFDKPLTQAGFYKAAQLAHDAQRKLALTLSDVFCVSRHRQAFLDLVSGEVDILLANENELLSLYETTDLKTAIESVRAHTDIAAITRGPKGAVIISGNQTYEIPAHPVETVIDTTGAGDLFAAGFLYGISHGKTLSESGRIGTIAAGEVISHYGARPLKKLRNLI